MDNGSLFEYIGGAAGCGKTYLARKRVEKNPIRSRLAASTGIAAVNLAQDGLYSTTINSLLWYYNTKSLEDNWTQGKLDRALRRLWDAGVEEIIVDEVSMMSGAQVEIILKGIDYLNESRKYNRPMGLTLIGDFCLALGTQVLMADGGILPVEEIEVGMQVMGPDSTPRKVIRTTHGESALFRVKQTNGDDYVVNGGHSIALRRSKDGQRQEWNGIRYPEFPDTFSMQVTDLANRSKKFKECFVGYKAGLVEFSDQSVAIDPYFLGLWLGDGDSDGPRITTPDPEVIQYCEYYADTLGMHCSLGNDTGAMRVRITNGRVGPIPNSLWERFRVYGLDNEKNIPEVYLVNTEAKRLQLLAGLLDSDGSWNGNRYVITSARETLTRQIKRLADHLGFRTGIREHVNNYQQGSSIAWTISIGGDTWRIPCRVARKKSEPRSLGRSRLTSVLDVSPAGYGKYAGIEIDGDHLFLLADGTVTHNCQLPPVSEREEGYAFEAKGWDRFESNTTILNEIKRQTDQDFIQALRAVRRGEGEKAVDFFSSRMSQRLDIEFEGTTVLAKNVEVDRFNELRLKRLDTPTVRFPSERDGKQLPEWKLIPHVFEAKIDALVMILVNKSSEGILRYVNGDLGYIREVGEDVAKVELIRTGEIVEVVYTRKENIKKNKTGGGEILGYCNHIPLRLAWATTCHKCVEASTRIPILGKGLVPISEILIGDETPYGTIKGKARSYRQGYKIVTKRGYEICCSIDHKWVTKEGLISINNLLGSESIKLAPLQPFRVSDELSEDMSWWLGLTVGDGNYSHKEYQIHFSCQDEELGERWKMVAECNATRPSWRSDKRGLHLTSKPFREYLEALGLTYVTGRDKTIPEAVFRGSSKIRAAFLKGLFDADGHVGTNRIVYATSSLKMATQIQDLLLSLGVISTKRQHKNNPRYGGFYYQIYVGAESIHDFRFWIGATKADKKEKLETVAPNRILNPSCGYDQIDHIEALEDELEMYDVEIDSPHLLAFEPFMGSNSQGLTLDRVQVNLNPPFFATGGMAYVALSRARTVSGLKIVCGNEQTFIKRCRMNEKVERWL